MPETTISKLVSALLIYFGIEIKHKKPYGGYYIDKSELDKKGTIEAIVLRSLTFANLMLEFKMQPDRLLQDRRSIGLENLYPVVCSVTQGRNLILYHQKFKGDDAPKEKMIQPYALKEFDGRWYVVGKEVKSGIIKKYALDRIKSTVVTDSKFSYPRTWNAEDFFAHVYGVLDDEELDPAYVVIEANEWARDYLRTKLLHHSQKEIQCEANYSLFRFFIKCTPDFLYELMRFGKNIKVLEPKSLRESIAEEFRRALENYK